MITRRMKRNVKWYVIYLILFLFFTDFELFRMKEYVTSSTWRGKASFFASFQVKYPSDLIAFVEMITSLCLILSIMYMSTKNDLERKISPPTSKYDWCVPLYKCHISLSRKFFFSILINISLENWNKINLTSFIEKTTI